MHKKSIIVSLAFMIGILLIGCSSDNDKSKDEDKKGKVSSEAKKDVISEKKIEIYSQKDETNAFELLKSKTNVDSQKYDFGVFVKAINGLAGNNEYFWALYVNDEKATKSADSIILKKGDKMGWIYEKVEM